MIVAVKNMDFNVIDKQAKGSALDLAWQEKSKPESLSSDF
jgi:hypothetical protein